MEDAAGPEAGERRVPSDSVKLDDVLADIRERVKGRRRTGVYPPGLETDLEAHFQRVVVDRVAPERSVVAARYSRLATMPAFNPARIPTKSKMPGGGMVHRLIGRLVHRQTQGVLEQVQEFATDVRELFEAMVERGSEDTQHGHPDLSDRIDMVIERLGVYERAPASSQLGAGELERRIEELESAEARRHFRPWFSQERFEQSLRGTREDLLDRYRDLAALLVDVGPVIDIGCGRGEFLSLLRDLGVEASGVEIDDALVRQAQADGLTVERADGLAWVAAAPDASLGGIVLIQVIEHLTPQEAAELVLLSIDKLRPGGRMVVETVNPMSLYVYAHSFYADPTHDHLVHPSYLRFLLEEAGFSDVNLMWRSPPPKEDVLELEDEDDGVRKANVERLNRLLYSPTDYIMIATK
jgi:2-polyprenyl-3-methyl-5-hydroxy-6-metoxy-1,4-benzoquinol methylase